MARRISLEHISKIEGHAEVNISILDGQIKECDIISAEGARYFEAIIKGRHYNEVPLITSRICGICSTGHTIASVKAIENAFKITPSLNCELLRELLTIGERIRSHASHLYMFALPDYVGFDSVIDMASKFKKEVSNCLEIIRIGNKLIKLIGGRDMHPYCAQVGGFSKYPQKQEIDIICDDIKNILPLIMKTIELFTSLDVPQYENDDMIYLSLDNRKSFPLHSGRIISNNGYVIEPEKYDDFIHEHFHIDDEAQSTSKFATLKGKDFMTGALARINNSYSFLDSEIKEIIEKNNINLPSTNIFANNLAQAFEILHWAKRAIKILEDYEFPNEPIIKPDLEPDKIYRGISAVEVPRGILFHDYSFNGDGILQKANIITPTVQNLANMQVNIKSYINEVLENTPDKAEDELILEIEKLIRCYDPCFSCSTHLIRLDKTKY